jgi:hypothetical protein
VGVGQQSAFQQTLLQGVDKLTFETCCSTEYSHPTGSMGIGSSTPPKYQTCRCSSPLYTIVQNL